MTEDTKTPQTAAEVIAHLKDRGIELTIVGTTVQPEPPTVGRGVADLINKFEAEIRILITPPAPPAALLESPVPESEARVPAVSDVVEPAPAELNAIAAQNSAELASLPAASATTPAATDSHA